MLGEKQTQVVQRIQNNSKTLEVRNVVFGAENRIMMIENLHSGTHSTSGISCNFGLWLSNMLLSEEKLTVQIADLKVLNYYVKIR